MRISPISSMNYKTCPRCKNEDPTLVEKSFLKSSTQDENVSFKGKGGFYTGLFIGAGAVTALAFAFMAPVIAAGAALTGTLTAVAGDKIEENIKEKIKGKSNNKK